MPNLDSISPTPLPILKFSREAARAENDPRTGELPGDYLRAILRSVRQPFLVLDGARNVRIANRAFCEHFRLAQQEIEGRPFYELANGPWNLPELHTLLEEILPQKNEVNDYEVHHTFGLPAPRTLLLHAQRLVETPGAEPLIILSLEDVTERTARAAALHDSEERFRQLANAMAPLAWIARPDGHIFWYNQRWYDYTGTTPAEMEGWGWQSVHLPSELDRVMENWQAALVKGEIFEMVFPLRGADGIFRSFLTRGIPLKNASGAVTQWFGTNTDVEKLKRSEEAVRLSETMLTALIEQAPGAVFTLDEKLCFQQVNGRALSVFKNMGSLLGEPFSAVMATLWGAKVAAQIMEIFQHTLETGERYVAQDFYEHRNDLGVDESYEWEIQRMAFPSGQFGVVCYFTDVSERRRSAKALQASEEFHRSIIENSSDCIKILDLAGNLLSLEAGHELLGITDSAPLIGQSWLDFWMREEDRQAACSAISAATTGKEGKFIGFFRTLHGKDKWWDVAITPIHSTNSEPTRLLAVSRDVTQRHELEERLLAQANALRTADRSKDEFLAMLAHELRNPLAPLRNAAKILQTNGSTEEEQVLAQRIIERQIENMSRMIDDLLDVARITEGKIELRKQPVSLESILTSATSLARSGCEARQQELSLAMPREPVFLNADATRLEQVFGNLLTNACKYGGDGCHIALRAEKVDGEVAVHVTDDGTGIAPELLPRIFDLFVQSSRTLDRAHGGLGIGLTLVQRLVKLHNGSIEARSEGLGKGTEFVVRLPVLAEPPAPAPPPAPVPIKATPRRILIVDDNTDSARSLALLQKRRGHESAAAYTGQEALKIAAEFLPEVVLLDIGLPGMNGFEVATKMRSMPELAGAFLIAMTGYASAEDRAQAKAAGFDEHLVKPVDLGILHEWLEQHPRLAGREN